MRAQLPAVVRIQHGAAASGENHAVLLHQFTQHRTLTPAECGFALEFEHERNANAVALLQGMIQIDEWQAELIGEVASDRGLACTHRADQVEVR